VFDDAVVHPSHVRQELGVEGQQDVKENALTVISVRHLTGMLGEGEAVLEKCKSLPSMGGHSPYPPRSFRNE